MASKFIAVVSTLLVASANAGFAPISYSYPTSAITSQSSNILRSPGNLAQISTYSKSVDTPFSSSSKSDIRVSNPGVYQSLSYATAPAAVHYAAPAHYAQPALAYAAHPAPAHYVQPALAYAAHPAPATTYTAHAAPALAYSQPAAIAAAPGPVVSHTTFSGLGYSYAF